MLMIDLDGCVDVELDVDVGLAFSDLVDVQRSKQPSGSQTQACDQKVVFQKAEDVHRVCGVHWPADFPDVAGHAECIE